MNLNNIPLELKQQPTWVCWRLHDERKVPINPDTLDFAKSDDPNTWHSFGDAVAQASADATLGIGFMFTPPYIGIDLDDCVVDGKLNEFAEQVVASCSSYTEFSPSGTGIHIIVKGELKNGSLRTNEIEIYQLARYFTMTGNRVPMTPAFIKQVDVSFLYPEGRRLNVKSVADRMAEMKPGNFHNSLMSLAGTLRNRGMDADSMYAILRPLAVAKGSDATQLMSICRAAEKYPIPQITVVEDDDSSLDAFLKVIVPTKWLIPLLIGEGKIALLCGREGVNKTWLAIDLAIEAARELGMWVGYPFSKRCKVLFVDQERDKSETQRRILAMMAAKGIVQDDLRGWLDVKCGSNYKLDDQRSFDSFRKRLEMVKPDLVVIDSLKTFQNLDICSNTDMQLIMERVKQLRTEFGCSIVFVYHENKGTFQRKRDNAEITTENIAGAKSIVEVPESIFVVDFQDQSSSFVHHVKSTIGSKVPPFMVRVRDVVPDKSQIVVERV